MRQLCAILIGMVCWSIHAVEVIKRGLGEGIDSTPTSMPTEHQKYVDEQYEKFMSERRKKQQDEIRRKEEEIKRNAPPKPTPGISPMKLGISRDPAVNNIPLTRQVSIKGSSYWFGSQLDIEGKIYPNKMVDGAQPRKLVAVGNFLIDETAVTNQQFADFVSATNYKTEAELYGWSFVLDSQASEEIIEEVDGPEGYGRVKDAVHWMAVVGAAWDHPFGLDSSVDGHLKDHPVVQVSHKDAREYCYWAGGRRLPNEYEWEYAARGGRTNQTYPWGNELLESRMNIWNGNFPKENLIMDGFHGTSPAKHYYPNDYGLYNMLGNVWEWVLGGTEEKRILRGGSFVDSKDGSFNHIVIVSTRQTNAGDSGASNIGFRCASSVDTTGNAVIADEASAYGITAVEKRSKSSSDKKSHGKKSQDTSNKAKKDNERSQDKSKSKAGQTSKPKEPRSSNSNTKAHAKTNDKANDKAKSRGKPTEDTKRHTRHKEDNDEDTVIVEL